MATNQSIFQANLRALELFDPRAAACIARFPQLHAIMFQHEMQEPSWTPPPLQDGDTIVLLGIGDGDKIAQLLDISNSRILVLEAALTACITVLHRYDLSAAIADGRLRLFLIPGLSPVGKEIFLRECMAELVDRLHSGRGTLHFVTTLTTEREAQLYIALRQGVQNAAGMIGRFASSFTPVPAYDVTVVSPCCAIFDDLAHCFLRLGLSTQLLRVPDVYGEWTPQQREAAQLSLASRPSRLVVTRNRCIFEAEGATDYPQPETLIPGGVAMWWWDVPNLTHFIELRHPRGSARNLSFARDILPGLPQGTEWLPPGARTPFVEAGLQPPIEQDIKLSFVGQSRMQTVHDNLAMLGNILHELGGTTPALARDLRRVQGYANMYDYLRQHYRDIKNEINTLSAAFPGHAYYLLYLLDMAVTAAFRIGAIEYLLKQGMEIVLYGDDDWLKVKGVNEGNFRGVIAPDELPALYRRTRINLNLNFMQVSSTINPKVLDIAAAGGVALTDYRPELEQLYPDPAVRPFSFFTFEQLPDKINRLLQLDLNQYRENVREHTIRHHTLQQRAMLIAEKFGLLKTG